MSVKITDNSAQLISERNNKVELALRFATEAVYREAEPHTPKKYGNLRANVIRSVVGLRGKIIWDKEYAIPQEAGITHGSKMRNYSTPGTGPHFARNAVVKIDRDRDTYLRKAGL